MNTIICLLVSACIIAGLQHISAYPHRTVTATKRVSSLLLSSSSFDPKEFNDMIKKVSPMISSDRNSAIDDKNDILNEIRNEQTARESVKDKEEIFRKYQYEDTLLPLLSDCNNYYSGKYNDCFWHQNADQVYVYIPINDDTINKNDIHAEFEAKSVKVFIRDKEVAAFQCLERIIPEGSFWILEKDKSNKRFIQLDLEKRYRMINWKNLFSLTSSVDSNSSDADNLNRKNDLLQKLLSANKGMSKLSGGATPAQSMEEMLSDEQLINSISSQINEASSYVSDDDFNVNDYITKTSPMYNSDNDNIIDAEEEK